MRISDWSSDVRSSDLMARVFIVQQKFAAASTEDFNAGKAAIGTGPYKLVEWVNSDHLVVDRNDGYWGPKQRSEVHTSELLSLMRTSYAVFCLKKKHQLPHISLLLHIHLYSNTH